MNSDRLNHHRGSDDAGGAIGIGLLIILILIVIWLVDQPSWLAGNVRTTYSQCMAAAQTPADQKVCDPTASTPTAQR
jgi:hypothetical protein